MRHEERAETKDECRHKLQRNWNAPCRFLLRLPRTADEVCAVVNPEGDHDTERDRELLQGDK